MMCVFVYEQEMSSWGETHKTVWRYACFNVAGVAKAKLGCSLDQVPDFVV